MLISDDRYIVDLKAAREFYAKELRFNSYPAIPGDIVELEIEGIGVLVNKVS